MNCADPNCNGEIRRGERYVSINRHIEVAEKPNLIERVRGHRDVIKVEDAETTAAYHLACAPQS